MFKDDKNRKTIHHAKLLEVMGISVAHFISSEFRIAVNSYHLVKNLLYYIHQNYIIIIDYVLAKLPPENAHNVLFITIIPRGVIYI